MNLLSVIPRREPVKLTVAAFLTLQRSGAFAAFAKVELLDGELWGVPRDDYEESDAEYPIKLTTNDFALLSASGAFEDFAKTELLDGLVYEMSPQYRPHGFIKDELAYRLRRALEDMGSAWHVATEQSVEIAPHSEPQPDVILTSEPRGSGAIPVRSVALIVEIADSTLRVDMGQKARIYAEAGVPEYWVADVSNGIVHQMWAPSGVTYAGQREVAFGEAVTAATIDGLSVDTGGL